MILIDSLLDAIYPPICPCCGATLVRGESPMCIDCRLKMPLSLTTDSPTDNELLNNKLAGTVPIESAVAYFTYHRDSPYAKLIHEAKYRGRPSIARKLASEFAIQLQSKGFFNGIDAVTPVPLNFWKQCKRGYNQSQYIARGIADTTDIPVIAAMKARRHATQTRKSAAARRQAVSGIFSASAEKLASVSHILIVDDICTTGSTLYACMEAIHQASPSTKISVLVLASTGML